ncbi:MAG: Gfo/Idh/MocA family oxidoreductase [Lachnospiraceae bacterium]|jgi:predicted dehydrogenase|nr:Gfo/Idh/MocA family oxidoreductase [Lachnospiraceae bacterium]
MKIGILGAGHIAEKMAKTIKYIGEKPYAVASRDLDKAKAFAKNFEFEKAYGSYEELLNDKELELVYVATPHSHHYDHIKLCLNHGKPVLCEKSFTQNAKQAREVLELSKEKNLYLGEAIWSRYMPSRAFANNIIKSGQIGEVKMVTANLGYNNMDRKDRLTNPNLAGGALLDVGVYSLNFIDMILDKPYTDIVTSCTYTDTGVDETDMITLKFDGGIIANAMSSIRVPTEQNGIVYGTKGFLIARNINNVDTIEVYNSDRKKIGQMPMPGVFTGFEYELSAAIRDVQAGKIESEEMPHSKILYIMELMDKCREEWGIVYPNEK